ncbi:MAG: HDIG domain-containing protein [Prevotellaceae bacterium]|jgi:uncharacterized protein|nr:HDIG domain-containing protein [Prevotellaceae bacterium]
MNPIIIIEKYYEKHSDLYNLLLQHSEDVANKSLSVIRKHPELNVDADFVAEAAMLHDVGVFLCYAPAIFCNGTHRYVEHGYLGAELLEREGFPRHALVAERHTGTGLSLAEILERNLPLPHRDMQPQSIEEQIICYADKFFSKSQPLHEQTLSEITKNLTKFGTEKAEIFMLWHEKFK